MTPPWRVVPWRWAAYALALAAVTCCQPACGLVQEVDLDLPDFEAPPYLECYLTPGEPYRLLLTRSSGFFDSIPSDSARFIDALTLDSARVTVTHGETVVTLDNRLSLEPRFGQIFNYTAAARVPDNYADSFRLRVELPDGGVITAATRLLPAVPYDSVLAEYDGERLARRDSLARIRTYFSDPDGARVNRFHHLLTSEGDGKRAERDYVLADDFSEGLTIGTVSLYRFAPREVVSVVTAHVDPVFERYLLSVQLALSSNGNPFAQPSPPLGNLRGEGSAVGALGIFTSYDYSEATVEIGE